MRHLPTVLLLGPTASGKSAAAMAVAQQLPAEIISVDSALVYRGMDIGTAKPTAQERALVPHHLIDLIDPSQTYSAARFASDARDAIAAVQARGRLPLLVGGTMLYARALVHGLDDLPTADDAVRAGIDARAREQGWPALHAELARVDPITAARLAPADAQRIQRALEVFELSGVPMSQWLQGNKAGASARGPRNKSEQRDQGPAGTRFITIALEPSDRAVLHQRIAARLQTMMDHGFVEEVRALRARGDLSPELPSMRCVGYRQIWSWLDEGEPAGAGWQRAFDACAAATRQLAKRQLTWLRQMARDHTIDCLAPDCDARVLAVVRNAIAAGASSIEGE